LRAALARRLVRLDPERSFRDLYGHDVVRMLGKLPADEERRPPTLTFAVGGAGAQAAMASAFLPSLSQPVHSAPTHINLVAGTRLDVAQQFERAIREAGLDGHRGRGVRVVVASTFEKYYAAFNDVLLSTDILWTKPSELSFYAALGIPLVLAKPVGSHER